MTNILSGLVLLVFSAVFWLGADAIPKSPLSGSVGADGLPKLLAVTLAVLSVGLILQSWLLMRRSTAAGKPVAVGGEGEEPPRRHMRAFGILAIGFGFAAIFEYAGYFASVAVLLIAVAIFYGVRSSRKLLVYGLAGAAVFYLIFVKLLGVVMPTGEIPGLSTWL